MVTFTVNNAFTHVDNPAPIQAAIDKFLVIKQDTFRREIDWARFRATGERVARNAYKQQVVNLYDFKDKMFPTGRIGYITDWCSQNGIPYQAFDNRVVPTQSVFAKYIGPPSDGSNGKPPRPYQLNASGKIYEAGGRGILWHATASGKTITAEHIMCNFGVKSLYLVPSLELLHQTHERMQEQIEGTKIGVLGDKIWNPQAFTIATPATLWSRWKRQECQDFLNSREMLILDECHHIQISGAKKKTTSSDVNTWYIIAINSPAYFRVGMTGTPGKSIEQKRALLECAVGRVIDRVSIRELIDAGIISDVEVHIHKMYHTETHLDYNDARHIGILTNPKFNEYIVQLAITKLREKKSVLIVTSSKSHQGPLIQQLFQKHGFEVPFVSGDDERKNRIKIRNDFRDGRLQALIGTIYREGVDFPKLDVGILADGGKDEKRTIQFLGRILRKVEGKDIAELHDFFHLDKKVYDKKLKDENGEYLRDEYGNIKTEQREIPGYLKKHAQERTAAYVEEELDKILYHEGVTV